MIFCDQGRSFIWFSNIKFKLLAQQNVVDTTINKNQLQNKMTRFYESRDS